jgi:hypothetical protein
VTPGGIAHHAGRWLDRILERPGATLIALAGLQVVATVALALAATHNGWVWFQGGDQIWFTSNGWAFAHLELPPADVSPGWSLILAPITLLLGSTFVETMPLVAVVNVLVLGPLALVCIWSLAGRIGGRALALWASILWVAAPFVAILLFVDRYHERWVDQFLPQAVGLTGMADYPSMVALLGVAALVARSLDTRAWTDAALAGCALGFAGLMKPPNFLIVPGIFLAYVLARRWREGAIVAVAVLPSLLALTVYKERGLGYIPLFAVEETRLAVGAIFGVDIDADRYLDISLDRWRVQMAQLREYLWSARLAQWAPLAGLLAVARVRLPLAALLAGWLSAFVVVKGMAPQASIEANTMWRLLMPAWPAYLLLLASIPLLVPTLARRLGSRVEAPAATPVRAWPFRAGVVLLAFAPLAFFALIPKLDNASLVLREERETLVLTHTRPELQPVATREPDGGMRLRWPAHDWGSQVSYRIYQADFPGSDVNCPPNQTWALRCILEADLVGQTSETTWVDPNPLPEAVYRIGVAVRYDGEEDGADVFVLSPPTEPVPPS